VLGHLEPSEVPDGAGCAFSVVSKAEKEASFTLFAVPAALHGVGLIRVNGELRKLTNRSMKHLDSKGQTFVEQWSDGVVDLTYRGRKTGEGEGGVTSEGEMVVSLSGSRATVKVRGGCGC
jgi:hypothetical protein